MSNAGAVLTSMSTFTNAMKPSSATCRRFSLLTTVKHVPDHNNDRPAHIDAARVAVESKATRAPDQHSRRASLDVNVEYAVAMVNEDSSLDDDDRCMCSFGTRRDSVCGQVQPKQSRRRNLKKQQPEQDES